MALCKGIRKIMAESRWWVSDIKISILLKKGWYSYIRVSLKREEYHIYMAQKQIQSRFRINDQ